MTIQAKTNGNLHEGVAPDEEMPRTVCPHLGLVDDAETWLAFPAGGNYCHHADPPEAVEINHQSSHCLTEDYTNCPAYQQKMGASLPAELRAPAATPDNRWRNLVAGTLGVIAVVALVLLLGAWWRNGDPAGVASPSASSTATATAPAATTASDTNEAAGAVAEESPTATSTPSPSATSIPPSPTGTATAIPTATATPSPTPSPSPVPDTPTPALPQAVVAVSQLNVRAGPGTGYPIIDEIPEGNRLTITGQNNGGDWWRVCCVGDGEQEGWIFGETVTVEGGIAAVPVVQNIPSPPSPTPES